MAFNKVIFLQISIFSLAIFVSDLFPIILPTEEKAEVTVSCAFKTAAAIICGPKVAIVATLLGTLMAEVSMQRPWYKTLFNAAEMILTTAAISFVYELLYDGSRMPFHSIQNGFAVLAMVVTYAFVNVGLVTIVVSLANGESFWHVWRTNLRDSAWNNLTIIPLGAVLATLFMYRSWSVLVLILPHGGGAQSFQYIGELQRQTREALVHMADAIDHRDPSTYWHSQRVARAAALIAQEMGMLAEDVDTIRMAARLHDLGKIGMSNALLFKPSGFDDAELAEFRRHPIIGAELIRSFRLFKEGQNIILHHHERYDGGGYPMGLAGEAIPMGSRVLAVADSFDAMISQRVYNRPITVADAAHELERNKGTQFDPKVVEAFLAILDRGDDRLIFIDEKSPVLEPARDSTGRVGPGPGRLPGPGGAPGGVRAGAPAAGLPHSPGPRRADPHLFRRLAGALRRRLVV